MPSYPHVQHWVEAFSLAARDLLTRHAPTQGWADRLLQAKPCATHCPHCVVVIIGEVCQHIPWKETDPDDLARRLLQNLLPVLHPIEDV